MATRLAIRRRDKTAKYSDKQKETPHPLENGDRLSRTEFERRYNAHPEVRHAELVEGVVYVPSPIRFTVHSEPHNQMNTWLGVYRASTPGVRAGDTPTVRLDNENEVQPDCALIWEQERGGKAIISDDNYIEGPPELVVEIAASSAAYDLHDKKRVYQRNGVQEYLVFQMYEQRVDWFALHEGVYQNLEPDKNGILKSERFSGLWLNTAAFWSGDYKALLETLQQGLTERKA